VERTELADDGPHPIALKKQRVIFGEAETRGRGDGGNIYTPGFGSLTARKNTGPYRVKLDQESGEQQ